LQVREVHGRRDLAAFVDFPYRLHAETALWVPPLRRDVRHLLSKDRNPFFGHADASYFLAEGDGAVVGRVAAVSNRLHNEIHEDDVGFFGLFDCVNDASVAAGLLERAGHWLRDRGHGRLRGPASFSANQEYGLLVEGFDSPPTLLSPYNPPYYSDLLEAHGLRKVKDLWAYEGAYPDDPVPERSMRAAEIVRRRLGVTLRPIDMSRFDEEVDHLKMLYNAAWEQNWGFVPMTDGEIDLMAKQMRPIVRPELVPIAEVDGEPIGFGMAVPDINEILRGNRSGRLFPAALRILWAVRRRRFRRARLVLMGVLPAYRGKGVDVALANWIWTNAAALGVEWGEVGWLLEDNAPVINVAERMTFRRYKVFRVYERPL
jgi:GNAT superfamily N-acetyltransferase